MKFMKTKCLFYFYERFSLDVTLVKTSCCSENCNRMSDNSSVTSIDDDNTENFVENPTRELLAEGFLGFFSPIIENLDSKVKQTQ